MNFISWHNLKPEVSLNLVLSLRAIIVPDGARTYSLLHGFKRNQSKRIHPFKLNFDVSFIMKHLQVDFTGFLSPKSKQNKFPLMLLQ